MTGKITKKSENQKQNKKTENQKKIQGWGTLCRLSRKNT